MVDFGRGCQEVKGDCLCWGLRVPLQVLFLGLPGMGEELDVRMLRAMVSPGLLDMGDWHSHIGEWG